MSEPSLFRRLLFCRLELCQTFSTESDDTGVWGQCWRCGKRVGFVGRDALRRYADEDYRRRHPKSEPRP